MTDRATGVALIVQARVSSTRLPGKVLMPLAGAPAIVRMMQRLEGVRSATHRILATSDEASDDALVEVCRQHSIEVSRGPLDDVLARVSAAVPDDCDVVVRLTGDCPLIDADLVERHIAIFQAERASFDYVTNAIERTYPDGLDVEVVGRDTLALAARRATSAFDREHVLPWARRHARMRAVKQDVDLSDLRWTLDTAADYAMIAAVYEALYADQPTFTSADVYRLILDRPELTRMDPEPQPAAARTECIARIEHHLAHHEASP